MKSLIASVCMALMAAALVAGCDRRAPEPAGKAGTAATPPAAPASPASR